MGLTVLDDWFPCAPLLPRLSLLPLLSLDDCCEGGMKTVVGLDETGRMYVRPVRAVILVEGLMSCLLNLRKKKRYQFNHIFIAPPYLACFHVQ